MGQTISPNFLYWAFLPQWECGYLFLSQHIDHTYVYQRLHTTMTNTFIVVRG